MTLNEVMTQTADAIREKTGKSELIAPIDFAEEIKGITSGGGESGGSNMEYLDISGMEYKVQVVMFSTLVKANGMIIPSGGLAEFALQGSDDFMSGVSTINQVAVDGTLEVDNGSGIVMLKTMIDGYDSIPRITKEQFYTLE